MNRSRGSNNRGWTQHDPPPPDPVIAMKQSQKHQRALVGGEQLKKPLKRKLKEYTVTNLLRYNKISKEEEVQKNSCFHSTGHRNNLGQFFLFKKRKKGGVERGKRALLPPPGPLHTGSASARSAEGPRVQNQDRGDHGGSPRSPGGGARRVRSGGLRV